MDFWPKNAESHPNALIFSLDSFTRVFLGRNDTRSYRFLKMQPSRCVSKKARRFSPCPHSQLTPSAATSHWPLASPASLPTRRRPQSSTSDSPQGVAAPDLPQGVSTSADSPVILCATPWFPCAIPEFPWAACFLCTSSSLSSWKGLSSLSLSRLVAQEFFCFPLDLMQRRFPCAAMLFCMSLWCLMLLFCVWCDCAIM
jgi:hypothetical protein